MNDINISMDHPNELIEWAEKFLLFSNKLNKKEREKRIRNCEGKKFFNTESNETIILGAHSIYRTMITVAHQLIEGKTFEEINKSIPSYKNAETIINHFKEYYKLFLFLLEDEKNTLKMIENMDNEEYFICHFLRNSKIDKTNEAKPLGLNNFGLSIISVSKGNPKKTKKNETFRGSLEILEKGGQLTKSGFYKIDGTIQNLDDIWSFNFSGNDNYGNFTITLGIINRSSSNQLSNFFLGSYSSIRGKTKAPLGGILVCERVLDKYSLDSKVNKYKSLLYEELNVQKSLRDRLEENSPLVEDYKIIRYFLLNTRVHVPFSPDIVISQFRDVMGKSARDFLENVKGTYLGFHIRLTDNDPLFETFLLTIFSDGLARIDRKKFDETAGYFRMSDNVLIGNFDFFPKDRYYRFRHTLVQDSSGNLRGISAGKNSNNTPSADRIWCKKINSIKELKENLSLLGSNIETRTEELIIDIDIEEIRKLLPSIEIDFLKDFNNNNTIEFYKNNKPMLNFFINRADKYTDSIFWSSCLQAYNTIFQNE